MWTLGSWLIGLYARWIRGPMFKVELGRTCRIMRRDEHNLTCRAKQHLLLNDPRVACIGIVYCAFWSGHAQYNLSNLLPVPTKIRLFYIQAVWGNSVRKNNTLVMTRLESRKYQKIRLHDSPRNFYYITYYKGTRYILTVSKLSESDNRLIIFYVY